MHPFSLEMEISSFVVRLELRQLSAIVIAVANVSNGRQQMPPSPSKASAA